MVRHWRGRTDRHHRAGNPIHAAVAERMIAMPS
jgi:hypothetical protein